MSDIKKNRDIEIYPSNKTQNVIRARLSALKANAKKLNSVLRKTGDVQTRLEKTINDERQTLLRRTNEDIIASDAPSQKNIFISYSAHGDKLAQLAISLAKRKHFLCVQASMSKFSFAAVRDRTLR